MPSGNPLLAWDAQAPHSSAAAVHRTLWLISGEQQPARQPCALAQRARRKPRARPAVWLSGVERACQRTCGLLSGRSCGIAAAEGTRQHRLVDSKPSASRPSAGRGLGTNGRLHSAAGHTGCAELAFTAWDVAGRLGCIGIDASCCGSLADCLVLSQGGGSGVGGGSE